MEQAYDILAEDDFKWSDDFNYQMKIDLLDMLTEHFIQIQDYEKCAKLKIILENLENTNDEHKDTESTT